MTLGWYNCKMFEKLKTVLLLLFVTIVACAQTINIGAGYKGGKYNAFAHSLRQILQKNSDINLNIYNTKGSIDNINGLKSNKFQLALIQSDVLFKHYKASYNKSDYPILPIACLYKEPIFVITNKNFILSIRDLYNRSINIGPSGSGIQDSAVILLKATDIYNFAQLQYLPIKKSIQALLNNELDAIFVNNITPQLKELIKNKKIFLLPISRYTLNNLHYTFPYYEKYQYKIDDYRTITTLAVRVILAANKELKPDTVNTILQNIHTNKDKFSKFLSGTSMFDTNPVKLWHHGTKKFAKEKNLTLYYNKDIDVSIIYAIVAVFLSIILFIIVIILLLYYSHIFHKYEGSHKLIRYSRNFYNWASIHKYKMILIFMVLIFLIFALFIKYFEHQWAIKNSTYSIFDGYSFYQILIWLFMFSCSGYNDNVFPVSSEAKFFASMIHVVGISGFIAMLGFYVYDRIKQYFMEVSGMGTKKMKNHIILCGWNSSAPTIVKSLTHENLVKRDQIVIIAETNEVIEKIKKCNFDPLYATYILGNANNRDDLDRANFKDAKTAIVLADENKENPDASSILNVLTIERYSKELIKKGKREKDIYTIVEIKNPQNTQLAYDAEVDQVVSLGDIESKIFTQSVMNPGIADFMQEVLTLNDQNDIYSCEITKDSPLIGKTFDEALVMLRKYQILLLSINVGYKKDLIEQQKIVKQYNLDDPIITNPFKENECSYRLKVGDLIIVLAQYEKTLTDALEKLKKS